MPSSRASSANCEVSRPRGPPPAPAPPRLPRTPPTLACAPGKPHPKWAEPNFCDGDATEKWHSRSSRRLQYAKGRPDDGGGGARLPPAIKTEQAADAAAQQQQQHSLYRFTPSPPHSGVDGGGAQPYALYGRHGGAAGVYSPADDASCYGSSPSLAYGEARHGASSANGEHYYQDAPQHAHHHHPQGAYVACPCLTNPAAGNTLIALTQQLQSTLVVLRQLPEHSTARQQAACVIARRVAELNDIMQ